jgi:hypothetical protein
VRRQFASPRTASSSPWDRLWVREFGRAADRSVSRPTEFAHPTGAENPAAPSQGAGAWTVIGGFASRPPSL